MIQSKNKGLFFDQTEFTLNMARTSSFSAPFTLESVKSVPLGNPEDVLEAVAEFADLRKGQYAQGIAGVYPSSRFVQRITVDHLNRLKDPAYLPQLLKEQFKINLSEYQHVCLSAKTGQPMNPQETPLKELIYCGAPPAELNQCQDQLVANTIYPHRMELGTVATIGALMHYCRVANITGPVLMAEISTASSNVYIFDNNDLSVCRPINHGVQGMFPVVQSELGLKDEASARKLFFSDTFDFTEMAPALLKNLLKELQASSGYYEVQTGQTIGHIFIGNIPSNLSWMTKTLSRSLGIETLDIDYEKWLSALGGTPSDTVDLLSLDQRWCGTFALMGDFTFEQPMQQSAATQPLAGGAQ